MDEMREIVTVEQVDRLFLILAVAAPIVGLLIGVLFGKRQGRRSRGALKGLLVGLLGPLNLLLWNVYNTLTDRMGLDTVKNLLVNLGLFVGLGVLAGLIFGFMARRYGHGGNGPVGDDGTSPAGAPPMVGMPGRGPGAERRPEEAQEPPREP